ncbi:MAG: SDR family oxidoreductase [Galactobacter sp.]
MNITLIGGHGKVALLLIPLLVDAGHQVTSVIRDPAQAEDITAAGAKPLVLSVDEASTDALAHAFEGQDAIVWSAGAGGGSPARTVAVDRDAAIRSMDAASAAGVKRYVMVSYMGAGRVNRVDESNSFYTYQEAKLAADTHLRTTSLDWTIVGPGTLTLGESPHGVSPAGAPAEARTGGRETSRALVAEVVAASLANPQSVGQTLDFSDGSLGLDEWIGGVAAGRIPGAQA